MLLGFVKINDISKQHWGKQMNVLDKITQFRLERNWTEYQLSVKSGLTQSTISSWYRKDMLPSITSLGKLCDAFGITMSQFFMDEETGQAVLLTEQQIRLLNYAARLNPQQYDSLLNFLRTIWPEEFK